MAIVYAVSANKGGVGKTSFVTNIATAIVTKQPKARVLIIDTDPQGNASMAFGKVPAHFEETIYDVLVDGVSMDAVKVPLMDRLDLVPANKDMATLVFDVLADVETYRRPLYLLKGPLDAIRDQYDFIFIDTPPDMGLIAGNVFAAADRVIIPFEPETFAVAGIIQVIEVVEDFQQKHRPELVIDGIVAMKVDSRTILHSEMLPKARKYCLEHGLHMYETVISKSIRFANATAYEGQPAVLADPGNHLVKSYYDILEEVLTHGKTAQSIG